MKTFKRHRTSAEVIATAKKLHIAVDTGRYDLGWDHLLLHMPGPDGVRCPVLFNVFNGRFFCAAEGFPYFTSDEDQPDAWYQALVEFFYTDEDYPQ